LLSEDAAQHSRESILVEIGLGDVAGDLAELSLPSIDN
jgi:hypothetical protein